MITSGYFNSSQGDRKYTAEQMSEIFDFVLNDGVLETYGEKLFVTPATSGLGVILGSGWAWFNQTWTKNDSSIPLMLDEPDPSLSRIDTVCLVVNKSQLVRANTFQVFKGLPSLSPQPATLQNTNTIIAHPLAYVTVPADASAISATNIEILVGKTACPFITSILQTTDITTLFQGWTEQYNLAYSAWNTNFNTSLAGWEADFNAWFEQLQTYLSADVVTNLQLQIDQLKTADTNNMATLRSEIATKVNTSDKATTTNAQAGTDDTKWMTPLKVKQAITYQVDQKMTLISGTKGSFVDSHRFYLIKNCRALYNPIHPIVLTNASTTQFLFGYYDNATPGYVTKTITVSTSTNGSVYLNLNYNSFQEQINYEWFNPNLIVARFHTSSSAFFLGFINHVNISLGYQSSVYNNYMPLIVSDVNKQYFYLVIGASNSYTVTKINWAGTSVLETKTISATGASNTILRGSVNTDTSGGFIVNSHYIKPSTTTSITLSEAAVSDVIYYSGYFYWLNGVTIYRLSPGGSSPTSKSISSKINSTSRFWCMANGNFIILSSDSTPKGIYGNISSFYNNLSCQEATFLPSYQLSRKQEICRFMFTTDFRVLDLQTLTFFSVDFPVPWGGISSVIGSNYLSIIEYDGSYTNTIGIVDIERTTYHGK